jgi:hypothetical protein
MYVCGPTVYAAHVGHAMSPVFDIIRRYLEYRGYQVRHAMNYTMWMTDHQQSQPDGHRPDPAGGEVSII